MLKKIIPYSLLTLCLVAMLYLGTKAYTYALAYEAHTTELVSYQGAQEQAKRKLSTLAKNILGDLYTDKSQVRYEGLQAQQLYAMQEAKQYTYYFMGFLVLILGSYFVISLRAFSILGGLSALLTLVFGLISPILMVTIHKKVEYLGDIVLSFESKGIIGSIAKLWDGGDIVVALVILLFSVIIPIVKILSLLFVSIFVESKMAHPVVKFFKAIGKWSMVDVFVVAVFLVYLTANKGDVSRAQVEVGLYFFLAYVIVSMLVSLSVDKMLYHLKR